MSKPYFAATAAVKRLDEHPKLERSVEVIKKLSKGFSEENETARKLDAALEQAWERVFGDPSPVAPSYEPEPQPMAQSKRTTSQVRKRSSTPVKPAAPKAKKPAPAKPEPKAPLPKAATKTKKQAASRQGGGKSKKARILAILNQLVNSKTRTFLTAAKPASQKIVERFLDAVETPQRKRNLIVLLRDLQRKLTEKKIRKSNALAPMIMDIQTTLINVANSQVDDNEFVQLSINDDQLYNLVAASRRYEFYPSVRLIRGYLRWYGKPSRKGANSLAERMTVLVAHVKSKKLKDPYLPVVEVLANGLNRYLEGDSMVTMEEAALRGLDGLQGLGNIGATDGPFPDVLPEEGLIGIGDYMRRKPQTGGLHLTEVGDLLGAPYRNAHIGIKGRAGHGKSYLAQALAKDLSQHGNVVYIAGEEFHSETFADKARQTGLSRKLNVQIAPSIKIDPSIQDEDDFLRVLAEKNVSFLILDSWQKMGLSDDFMMKAKKRCPNLGVVYIFQVTKDGKARGSETLIHDVDIVVNVEEGWAETEKQRSGEQRRMKVPYMSYNSFGR